MLHRMHWSQGLGNLSLHPFRMYQEDLSHSGLPMRWLRCRTFGKWQHLYHLSRVRRLPHIGLRWAGFLSFWYIWYKFQHQKYPQDSRVAGRCFSMYHISRKRFTRGVCRYTVLHRHPRKNQRHWQLVRSLLPPGRRGEDRAFLRHHFGVP